MKNREKISKMIITAGLAFSIPFELAVGPFVGYFIGDFLKNKFRMNNFIIYCMVILGFIWSFNNAISIIKMMLKINKNR